MLENFTVMDTAANVSSHRAVFNKFLFAGIRKNRVSYKFDIVIRALGVVFMLST